MRDRFGNSWCEVIEGGERFPAYRSEGFEEEIIRRDHPLLPGEKLEHFLHEEGRLPESPE